MKIPSKPIEKIRVHLPQDPSVGMPSVDFFITADGGWIIHNDDLDEEYLRDMRRILSEAFSELFDDRAQVIFDFEDEDSYFEPPEREN